MRTYIAGAITNNPDYIEHFLNGSVDVVNMGLTPVNPIELEHNHDKTWSSYMKECLSCLLKCEAIYMLRSWENSEGAKIEYNLAKSLGLKIIHQ